METEQNNTAGRTAGRLVLWALMLGGLGAAFWPYLSHEMWLRWFPVWDEPGLSLYDRLVKGESYYTHGPLVPLVSLLIVGLLVRYTRMAVRPNLPLGIPVLLAGLLLQVTAVFARVNFAQGFALVIVVAGLVILLWGWQVFRRFWFAVALLSFMVPLPEVTIYDLNFYLKMRATWLGVGLARAAGILVEYQGNQVFLMPDKQMEVANVCNGLRTLISLLAFGALYAYVCRLRGLWRAFLFLMTVPVAVISNAVRVAALIVVADLWNVPTATGTFHDVSGLLIYVIAFLLMFGLEKLVLSGLRLVGRPVKVAGLFEDVRRRPQDVSPVRTMLGAAWRPGAAVAVVLIGLTAGAGYRLSLAVPPRWDARVAEKALPDTMVVQGTSFVGERRILPREVVRVLETDDYLYSLYQAPGVPPMDFLIIYSKDNRRGTHAPDQCLEGGGEKIVHKGTVLVDGIDGREAVRCRELIVQDADGPNRRYFLYVYKCGPRYTSSFWRQQITIFANGLLSRDASGALIRLSMPVETDVERARQWCQAFMRESVPHLDRALDLTREEP